MPYRNLASFVVSAFVLCAISSSAVADTIQLVNGDRLNGKLVSLDDKQVTLRSESFGELKIAREKVELIALGNKGIPDFKPTVIGQTAATTQSGGQLLNQVAPLLQDPAVQKQLAPMIDQLLGAGGLGDLQKNVGEARRGLQDLRKDFGNGPEATALDAYIRLFNAISPPSPADSRPTSPGRNSPLPKKQSPPKTAESKKSP
jgi:hypothetical protein